MPIPRIPITDSTLHSPPNPSFDLFQLHLPDRLPKAVSSLHPPPAAPRDVGGAGPTAAPRALIAHAVHRLLTRREVATRKDNKETYAGVDDAVENLEHIVEHLWADSTLADRQALWARFSAWAARNGEPADADAAVLFVAVTGVSIQTQLTYAKALSGTMLRLGMENQPLKTFAAVLRAAGAEIPIAPAVPIPRETLYAFVQHVLTLRMHDVALAVLLAWKTASRWGDVRRLRRDQFIVVEEDRVVIDWQQVPKGWRGKTRHPSQLVVVRGDATLAIYRLLMSRGDFAALTTTTTADFRRLLRSHPPTARYSAHSIKRGAADFLLQLRATGVLLPADDERVGRLLKHRAHCALPPQTLGYVSNRVALAEALETGLVTRHL